MRDRSSWTSAAFFSCFSQCRNVCIVFTSQQNTSKYLFDSPCWSSPSLKTELPLIYRSRQKQILLFWFQSPPRKQIPFSMRSIERSIHSRKPLPLPQWKTPRISSGPTAFSTAEHKVCALTYWFSLGTSFFFGRRVAGQEVVWNWKIKIWWTSEA